MVKGIVIRQAFLVVDLLLTLLVVFGTYLIISEVFGVQSDAVVAHNNSDPKAEDFKLAKVGTRQSYDSLAESAMFGMAGQSDKVKPAESEVLTEQPSETRLPLKLRGTSTVTAASPVATAVIENGVDKVTQTYYLGQDVIRDQVSLAAVRKREVILLNKHTKARELLRMEEESVVGDTAPILGTGPRLSPGQGRGADISHRVGLKRDELIEELSVSYPELAARLDPEPYYDSSGQMAGIMSNSLSDVPMAVKMGLEDGDIVQAINGVNIDSEGKIFEIVNRFRNLSTFQVKILRKGKPMMITYQLE
jgi:type II secretion system protein C